MTPRVRTLAEIIAQSNATYDPLRQRKQQQIQEAELEGTTARGELGNRRTQAFQDIEQIASNKGVAFGTIPSIQQRTFDRDVFDPASSRIDDFVRNRRSQLQDSIFDIDRTQQTEARQLQAADQDTLARFQSEQARLAQEQAEFEAKMELERQKIAAANRRAAMSASRSSGRSSSGASGIGASSSFKMTPRDDGGFDFYDNRSGQPMSAAQYANAQGLNIEDVLASMAAKGDDYAGQVLRQIENDPFISDPRQQARYAQQYPSLFWGL